MLAAVIFDFDGIIVDTEPMHYKAFQEVLEGDGLSHTWDEYVADYIGFDDRDALRVMFKNAGRLLEDYKLNELIEAKALTFRELIDRDDVTPFPGAVELIERLNGHVPLGLCSGALRGDIVPILEKLHLTLAFDVAVTAEDVPVSKPDPASYRLAVERLARTFPNRNVEARNSLAIEDTPTGLQSAQGAGLNVLAVTNSHPRESLAGATDVVESLEGLTEDALAALVSLDGDKP